MRHPLLFPGAALLLLGVSCAVVPEGPPPAPPTPPEAGAVREQLLKDEAGPRTIRGLATVRYEGPAGSGSATQAVLLAVPDRARLETLSPLGTTAVVVVLRGEEVRVHSLLANAYGVGQATRETVGRLTRIPIPPSPFLRLLAGLPPLPLRASDPRLLVTMVGAAVRVDSVDGGFWQRLWTERDGVGVEGGELGDASGPLLTFAFADHRPVGDATFPFAIRLESVTTGSRLDLHYSTVRLGEPIEGSLFELPRPTAPGTRLLDLDGPGPKDGGQGSESRGGMP